MEMQQRLGCAVMKANYELQRTRVQQVLPKTHKRKRESESHTENFFSRLPWIHDSMENRGPVEATAVEASKHLPNSTHVTEKHKQWGILNTFANVDGNENITALLRMLTI